MEEKLQQTAEDFLVRVSQKLPGTKAAKVFIVATIGLPGSGRTTVAKVLVASLNGTVLLSSNSARYLLRETGLSWGENVSQVLKYAATALLQSGYSIVLDGNAANEDDQKNIDEIAIANGAKVFYIRVNVNPNVAKIREKAKYDNPNWVSNFEDCRVNTTEKMLENIDQRAELYNNLKSSDIPGLVGEIDNNGNLEDLEKQIMELADKIKEG